MNKRVFLPPYTLPIVFFVLVISIGSILLHSRMSQAGYQTSWTDAIFTATSAACVTGLSVVDVGSRLNGIGQTVILLLIQVGGLGIMSFTSLAFYLWRQRISLTDRMAVGQSLLHDPTFHLGKFLARIVVWTFLIEAIGAVLIYFLAPTAVTPFSAVFHAVSAFCNAGFSLQNDSLISWRGNPGINLVFMALIILGGLGFSVIVELQSQAASRLRLGRTGSHGKINWYSHIVIKTSLYLVLAGWVGIYFAEFVGYNRHLPVGESLIAALFQSVTSRTAGFNTLEIGRMTNMSLVIMILLMFIGGAPGSCAGGIKVTTFRALIAFIMAQARGRRQTVIGKYALDDKTLNNSLVLCVFAGAIVIVGIFLLNMTEGGDMPHPQTRGLFLEIVFETVSAFGTVGLSTGLTAKLTVTGKYIVMALMFIGRLGPLVFLAAMQSLRQELHFSYPEDKLLIG